MQSDEPWSPAQIAARLNAQAIRLGVSPNALLKESGVTERAIRDLRAGHAPRLETVIRLARGFRFEGGINELIGMEPHRTPCDAAVLHVAIELVAATIDERGSPLHAMPHIVAALTAFAYERLFEARELDANALESRAALHLISSMLRSEFAKRQAEKS